MFGRRVLDQSLIRFPESYVLSAVTAGSIFCDNYRFVFSDLDVVVAKENNLIFCEMKRFLNNKIRIGQTQWKIMNLLYSKHSRNIFFIGINELQVLNKNDLMYVVNLTDIRKGTVLIKHIPYGIEIEKKDMLQTTVENFRNIIDNCK